MSSYLMSSDSIKGLYRLDKWSAKCHHPDKCPLNCGIAENIRENGHPPILPGAHNQTVITTLQRGVTQNLRGMLMSLKRCEDVTLLREKKSASHEALSAVQVSL